MAFHEVECSFNPFAFGGHPSLNYHAFYAFLDLIIQFFSNQLCLSLGLVNFLMHEGLALPLLIFELSRRLLLLLLALGTERDQF